MLAIGFLLAYCITMPPLGFLGFLHGIGLMHDLPEFFRGGADYYGLFIALGVAFAIVVAMLPTRRLFMWGITLLGFIAVSSMGGCAMMLSGLKDIGS